MNDGWEIKQTKHGISVTSKQYREAIDKIIMNKPPEVIYFGCIGSAGHYIRSKNNPRLRYHETPWGEKLDCGPLNDSKIPDHPDGQIHFEQKDGWSGIFFWDRSVDRRPGSHSDFLVAALVTKDELMALARSQWPEIFSRHGFPLRLELLQGCRIISRWTTREADGACNACQSREDSKVLLIELATTSFRLCAVCARMLLGKVESDLEE